jgi:hypothetical protein
MPFNNMMRPQGVGQGLGPSAKGMGQMMGGMQGPKQPMQQMGNRMGQKPGMRMGQQPQGTYGNGAPGPVVQQGPPPWAGPRQMNPQMPTEDNRQGMPQRPGMGMGPSFGNLQQMMQQMQQAGGQPPPGIQWNRDPNRAIFG